MYQVRRYMNLIVKDASVYKKGIFFFLYLPLSSLLIPVDIWKPDEIYGFFIFPIFMLTMVYLVVLIMNEAKNKGTSFLVTTAYNRKDIIIARYLFCFTMAIVQIVLGFIAMLLVVRTLMLISVVSLLMIFLISCVIISVLVPVSFKLRMTPFVFVAIVCEIPFIWLSSFINKKIVNYGNSQDVYIMLITFIVISIALITLSTFLSKRIYLKKDL